MTTILGAGSQTLAQGLAATSQMAARPQFELSFSLLQNSLLDRLSEKIDKLNDSSGVDKVDAFIEMQRKQLIRALPPIGKFGNVTQYNKDVMVDMFGHMDSIDAANTASNSTEFDKFVAQMNDSTEMLKKPNGIAAGIYIKDGLETLRDNGSGLLNYDDYADDAARATAISDFRSGLNSSLAVLEITLDTARNISGDLQTKLNSLDLQVMADRSVKEVELLDDIEAARDEHANFLKSLSIAFEVAIQGAEQVGNTLLNGYKAPSGSVLNMFS